MGTGPEKAELRRMWSCGGEKAALNNMGRSSKFLRFPRTAGRYYIPKKNHFLYYTRNNDACTGNYQAIKAGQ